MLLELRNLPAPAKLNLFLHVTGRRADGYHLLESVFELIDLGDRIDLRLRDDDAIVLDDPIDGVPDEANLCVRAARLLAAEAGRPLGAHIGLRKRLPMGAGLGGGSSDAATTLLGLHRLWQLDLDATRLAALSLRLGADVPFFLFGRSALAGGIGERLVPVALPARYYVVVSPGIPVATAAVFGAPELTRNTKPLRIAGFSRHGPTGEETGRKPVVLRAEDPVLANALAAAVNDLQPVVLGRFPAVAIALDLLRRAAQKSRADASRARMTGSGSCLFLPVDGEALARRIADEVEVGLAAVGLSGAAWVARSLARHPMSRPQPVHRGDG